MAYIRLTTWNGCYNVGIFKSLYSEDCRDSRYGSITHHYYIVVGDKLYSCADVRSVETSTRKLEFRADDCADDPDGSTRFWRLAKLLDF